MTRKDYVKLAGALAEARAELNTTNGTLSGGVAEYAIEAVEVRIARILAEDSPNFDRHRFHMAAIGQPITGRDRVTLADGVVRRAARIPGSDRP